ncbi:MAG TPA: GGDEF domain-containing protein [Rubrivivax sp.]|jgi:diguanylate cyclase (GGDEF)-like protein|nr:GGDEF domain-containing protein [Rubrivivax sp.]
MNPPKPPLSGRPPPDKRRVASAAPRASDAPDASRGAPGPGLSLPAVGLLLGLGAVLLAGGIAYLVQLFALGWLNGGAAAALAAVLGVLAAALPLGWLVRKLAREAEAAGIDHAGRGGAAPPAGMSRALFMDLAEREWARARRYGTGAAMLLVDVDRYARLCEARGAAAGDAVISELLRQTAPTLRTADVLTRFSESQMAVFLAHADATGALDVAERIRERAEQLEVPWPSSTGKQRLRVTASVGVAHLRPAHLNLQALVDDAEDAVQASRQASGNCVRAAPVESARLRHPAAWRDERRAKPRPGAAPN